MEDTISPDLTTVDVSASLVEALNVARHYHTEKALVSRKSVRGHDGITPYWVHPTLGAMLIMEDSNGPILAQVQERLTLALAMAWHDLLEDTHFGEENFELLVKVVPSSEIRERVCSLVKGCTFSNGSSTEEYAYLVANANAISDEIWYLKMVDKWINLMSPDYFIQKGKLDFYRGFLGYLAERVAHTKYKDSVLLQNIQGYLQEVHWFVASVNVREGKQRRTRTWHYFRSREDAISDVQKDPSFYFESGWYTHVVIEGIPVVPAISDIEMPNRYWEREEIWLELGEDTAILCSKPPSLERVVNFTLG